MTHGRASRNITTTSQRPCFVSTFPGKDALSEHHCTVLEANNLGEIDVEEIGGDCAVLGRRQTEFVTGVDGNIIKDGIIYLADRNQPHHRLGNVYVYDLMEKLNYHDGLKTMAWIFEALPARRIMVDPIVTINSTSTRSVAERIIISV